MATPTEFVKPDFPQTKITFVGESVTRVAPSFAEVVAVPIAHDWGLLGSEDEGLQLITSFAEFEAKYGTSDTPGRRAVLSAFAGQNLPGQGGAGAVYVYRMAVAGTAAKATASFNNTTPAAALTVTAKHFGDFGEGIGIGIGDDPADAAMDRLTIYVGGVPVERYTYTPTDIAGLVAQINLMSKYVTATSAITGVALTATPAGNPTELANGNNGDTLTLTEYTAAMSALEFKSFELLAFPNLTDVTIRAAVASWVQSQDDANRPVMLVLGGAAGESLATAITRSAALGDEHIVNLGVGTYFDELLETNVSTAELAPRIAGVLAARGEGKALTGAELGGLSLVGSTGIDSDQIRTAIDNGVTAIMRSSSPTAELVIAQGVTTYTSKSNAAKPYDVFSEPRMVRIMDIFVRGMKAWGDEQGIGDLPVNDDSRAAVRGQAKKRIDDLLARGLILADPQPFADTPVPGEGSGLEDALLFEFGWKFARTANYIIGNGRVR